MSEALTVPAKAGDDKLTSLFDRAKPRLLAVVNDPKFADRLVSVALNCVARTPLLKLCTPDSIVRCVLQAAEMGLEPGGTLGDAWLVPYRGKSGSYDAQLIPGYRGLVRLALEEGIAQRIDAVVVRKGDVFEYDSASLPPRPSHRPVPFNDGELVGVYCVVLLPGRNEQKIEVMSKAQVDAIRRRSKSGDSGPWGSDYEEMAKKTVWKRLAKYLGIRPSSRLGRAIEIDDAEEFGESEAAKEAVRTTAKAGQAFDEAARKIASSYPAVTAPPAKPAPAQVPEEVPAQEEQAGYQDPKEQGDYQDPGPPPASQAEQDAIEDAKDRAAIPPKKERGLGKALPKSKGKTAQPQLPVEHQEAEGIEDGEDLV